MGNSKRASVQIRPFDADDITTASTHPFDDDGYIGYDPRLLSQRFNESYFAAADDEEHYTAVANPPYHGDGLPSLTRLEESPPPSSTSMPPSSVTLPACHSLTAGVVLARELAETSQTQSVETDNEEDNKHEHKHGHGHGHEHEHKHEHGHGKPGHGGHKGHGDGETDANQN
ncbi:hypothetical protein F0562_010037 [Nyssa sinensis]|uniref:Uncharacterized protein n=1 Tax=Nyssa sinensis TaxID=561372 RepID=A0A5J5A0D3_9ASTE|nr:hypothetical protein F0562_010037 [Nyssa sinensis]